MNSYLTQYLFIMWYVILQYKKLRSFSEFHNPRKLNYHKDNAKNFTLFLSFSPSLSKVVFISRSVLETVYSEQIIISDERKAVTRNCSDWRVAVNSRFSSNRTNKRFLLRVSCGRRKTRLCTVEDGEFPQHERAARKRPWMFGFSVYTARTKKSRG